MVGDNWIEFYFNLWYIQLLWWYVVGDNWTSLRPKAGLQPAGGPKKPGGAAGAAGQNKHCLCAIWIVAYLYLVSQLLGISFFSKTVSSNELKLNLVLEDAILRHLRLFPTIFHVRNSFKCALKFLGLSKMGQNRLFRH